MSFHSDIVSLEPFRPHALDDLTQMRAFPEGAMPEPAYKKLCEQYAAVEDVKIERIIYKNDWLNITGLIATPSVPAKGVVVYNRGGSGNYGILTVHAVMRQFVLLARAGYLVVGSNYRGNDGSEGKDEFGGGDVDDAVKLHSIARAHPLATGGDYLIGHSRGGMMCFLMLKRGFKADAAVALAPVCDIRGWKIDESLHEDRSAVCWPERITTPTLLLHGTRDEAIPHSQSEMLDSLLTVPHELHLYEGGNHALTRHWNDVMARQLAWLSAH